MGVGGVVADVAILLLFGAPVAVTAVDPPHRPVVMVGDRKITRLNPSHKPISHAGSCL